MTTSMIIFIIFAIVIGIILVGGIGFYIAARMFTNAAFELAGDFIRHSKHSSR